MTTRLPPGLRQAMRQTRLLLAGLAVVVLASCGGGDDSTPYRSVGMTGESIAYKLDTANLTYSYEITESSSGLVGVSRSGTLTANADGSYTPSGAPDSRLVVLSNGLLLGAVRESIGNAVATMPFIGLRDTVTTTAALATQYNYVHRGCTPAQCQASYGTLRLDASGAWSSCRGANLAAGACTGASDSGTLEPRAEGEWQVKSADGTDIGTATGFNAAGQTLLVINLKDPRVGGFGSGMLIGGHQSTMTPAVSDGSYIAGMNTGTWFSFAASGNDIDITHLNFTPVDLGLTIAANAPWSGMTTTAWGEVGFISGSGLYLLMTPGGDLELGVKLR